MSTCWIPVKTDFFHLLAKTVIGAKRFATRTTLNHHIHENMAILKDPVFWSPWFPSDTVPNAYRMSKPMFDMHMRIDLKLEGDDDELEE